MGVLSKLIANATTTVQYSDMASLVESVTGQFSVANIVALLGSCIGAVMGFVFLWWGIRKLYRMITSAALKGKASI